MINKNANPEQGNFEFWYNPQTFGYIIISYKGEDKEIIDVPATFNGKQVIGIAEAAFQNLKNLKIIHLPTSILEVADKLCYNCPKYLTAQIQLAKDEPLNTNTAPTVVASKPLQSAQYKNNPNYIQVALSQKELIDLYSNSPKIMAEIDNLSKIGSRLTMGKYDFARLVDVMPELSSKKNYLISEPTKGFTLER